MIEKDILKKKMKEFEVIEYIENTVDKPGYAFTEIQRTPLGEKVIIHTSKPGLIVGRRGVSIRELTEVLKEKFGFENPQIEVAEVTNPNLNPHYVAKYITGVFYRFGPSRFKFIGYKMLEDMIKSGAVGAEIVISGRGIPSQRAKSWRFTSGHLKKSGDISENHMKKGFATAHLKSGSVGVKVIILTPDIKLPDEVKVYEAPIDIQDVTKEIPPEKIIKEKKEEKTEKKKETKKEKPRKTKEKEAEAKKTEKVPTARELAEKKAKEKKSVKKKTKKDGNHKEK